jgi:hypothetical protein
MNLTSIFARLLSLFGHKKRKKASRAVYKATNGALAAKHGIVIPWKDG